MNKTNSDIASFLPPACAGLSARDDSFSGMYNRLLDDGWPIELAWREALARVQWLENHEQREQDTNKQEENNP